MCGQSLNGTCTYVAAYRSLPLSGYLLHLMSKDTVPLDLNFTHARAQKATARNIHGNAPE